MKNICFCFSRQTKHEYTEKPTANVPNHLVNAFNLTQ